MSISYSKLIVYAVLGAPEALPTTLAVFAADRVGITDSAVRQGQAIQVQAADTLKITEVASRYFPRPLISIEEPLAITETVVVSITAVKFIVVPPTYITTTPGQEIGLGKRNLLVRDYIPSAFWNYSLFKPGFCTINFTVDTVDNLVILEKELFQWKTGDAVLLSTTGTLPAALGARVGTNFSIKPSAVDLETDEITLPPYAWTTGAIVMFQNLGILPTPLIPYQKYYVIVVSGTKVKLALTLADALLGNAVHLENAGAGNLFQFEVTNPIFFIIVEDYNVTTLRLASTYEEALNKLPVSIADKGSGQHSMTYYGRDPSVIDILQFVVETEGDYSDIAQKYSNYFRNVEVAEAIIKEEGYGYLLDVLQLTPISTEELLLLIPLIHFLKGSKQGLELVLKTIGVQYSLQEWWEYSGGIPDTFKATIKIPEGSSEEDVYRFTLSLMSFIRNYVYPIPIFDWVGYSVTLDTFDHSFWVPSLTAPELSIVFSARPRIVLMLPEDNTPPPTPGNEVAFAGTGDLIHGFTWQKIMDFPTVDASGGSFLADNTSPYRIGNNNGLNVVLGYGMDDATPNPLPSMRRYGTDGFFTTQSLFGADEYYTFPHWEEFDVGPSGLAVAATYTANNTGYKIRVSNDFGATWGSKINIDFLYSQLGAAGYIAVEPGPFSVKCDLVTGIFYLAVAYNQETANYIILLQSTNGTTWSFVQQWVSPLPGAEASISLAANQGFLYLIAQQANGPIIWHSRDSGKTWETTSIDSSSLGGASSNCAVTAQGAVALASFPTLSTGGIGVNLKILQTEDGGNTWNPTFEFDQPHDFPMADVLSHNLRSSGPWCALSIANLYYPFIGGGATWVGTDNVVHDMEGESGSGSEQFLCFWLSQNSGRTWNLVQSTIPADDWGSQSLDIYTQGVFVPPAGVIPFSVSVADPIACSDDNPVMYATAFSASASDLLVCTDLIHPPADAYTTLLLPMNGPDGSSIFVDESQYHNVVDNYPNFGDPVTIRTSTYKFNGSSAQFGDSYLFLPDKTFGVFPGDWTVDLWANFYGFPTLSYPSYMMFCGKTDGGETFHENLGMGYGDGTNWYVFGNFSYPGNANSFSCLFPLQMGVWYHFEFSVFDATPFIFINGFNQSLSLTGSDFHSTDTTHYYHVGREGEITQYYLQAYMNQFRVSNGISRHQSNFTPSNEPYGSGGIVLVG